MMKKREVYPNPAVVLVALEVRHPAAEVMSPGALAKVKKTLSNDVPLLRETTLVNLNLQGASNGPPEVITEVAPKFFSRDGGTAVTFRKEALVVETTRYASYERLRELVGLAVRDRLAARPLDGVDRIGLRYIDEIRVPEMDADGGTSAWAPWVDPSLLGPGALAPELGLAAAQFQGFAMFSAGPERTLALRYGPMHGYAVNPDGDLKRTTTPPGPYFLLDIDSYWTASSVTPEARNDWVLDVCDELHKPVRTLFERLITERLREEVLRHGRY